VGEKRREAGMKKIAIGCDEAAYELKELLKQFLAEQEIEVEDFGTHDMKPVLYPNIAFAVAEAVAAGRFERAILCCGTGIGMAICANKVPGVRAAVGHYVYSAERARKSNDAQVLTLGARVIGPELAKTIVAAWLRSEFEPRSTVKVALIRAYEQKGSSGAVDPGRKAGG
jgi:ribose 5-phosphate isomerase B